MFRSIETFDTELPADSVEWCPAENQRDILACGTYKLNNASEALDRSVARTGRIFLIRYEEAGKMRVLQKLDVPAVFDMKWNYPGSNGKILLGVANATGAIEVYDFNEETALELCANMEISNDEGRSMALSMDWSNQSIDGRLVSSDSKGSISIFQTRESKYECIDRWKAHDYEAWVAVFDNKNDNILYTGGDDGIFKCYDVRIDKSCARVIKSHNAGVTSIVNHPTKNNLVVSGSYDELLRLWDPRSFRMPMSIVNLKGGIWRLKWDHTGRCLLLAACMYGGFRLVDCTYELTPDLLTDFNEHESIAYGCDWSRMTKDDIARMNIPLETADNVFIVATCSFYDQLLKISTVHL